MSNHHNTGNKYAEKDEKKESFIHARCLPAEKALFVKAAIASNLKLTPWIIETLNKAAKEVLHDNNRQ